MTQEVIQVFAYNLPVKDLSFTERKGFLLHTTVMGKKIWSEASPLPSWSQETFEEILFFIQKSPHLSLESLSILPPSLQFAIESLLEEKKQIEMGFFTSEKALINAFVTGPIQTMEKKFIRALESGFTTIKCKISQLQEEDAMAFLKSIKGLATLRLDLNRAWSLEKALRFFSHFSKEDFEYIEEPLNQIKDLPHFPYPIALDETTRELSPQDLPHIPSLEALVIKPTLLGSYANFQSWINFAKERKKKVTLCTSFESGVGLLQIAKISKRLEKSGSISPNAIGLDTLQFFSQDVLLHPFPMDRHEVIIPESIEVNPSILSKVGQIFW